MPYAVVEARLAAQEVRRREIATGRALDGHLVDYPLRDQVADSGRRSHVAEHRPERSAGGAGEEAGGAHPLADGPRRKRLVGRGRAVAAEGALGCGVELGACLSAAGHDDVATRPEDLESHGGGATGAFPSAPVERLHLAVIRELRRGHRPALPHLGQDGLDDCRRHPALALAVGPPRRLGAMPLGAIVGECRGGKETALLREVLKGATGKEMPPDVAAPDAVDARQHDEVRVRADRRRADRAGCSAAASALRAPRVRRCQAGDRARDARPARGGPGHE